MPTQSVDLTGEFQQYADELIASGRYQNGAEVVRAAMDALMREECDDEAKTAFLDQALDDAEASGLFQGDPFESVRQEMGWEPKK